MQVPDHVRAQLRAMLDDPNHVGKQVAQKIDRSRSTLYRILSGDVGPKTLRKLMREFPPPPELN